MTAEKSKKVRAIGEFFIGVGIVLAIAVVAENFSGSFRPETHPAFLLMSCVSVTAGSMLVILSK